MNILYVRDIKTGNFIVDVKGFRLGVHRDTMTHVLGVSPRAVLGSTTISDRQLASIGFYIVPSAQAEAAAV